MANQLYRPPVYSHNQWRKEQIFVSSASANGLISGGVVPNVNDTVISWNGNIKYEERVTYVDPVTNLSTLEAVELPNSGNTAMVGVPVGVGNLSNVANLIMNPVDAKLSSVIDSRLPIYGVDLGYVRIFLGTDISSEGQVISARYNSAGALIDDKVVMLQSDVGDANLLRYITRPFNLLVTLPEDTLCTAVFYSDSGGIVMWQELVIKHNHTIANVQSEALFIKGVVLESAYQNPINEQEILIPKNLLNISFSPRIFKDYQSGQREELFVGSSNVSLVGWGDYLTGEVGERFPLVLSYVLGTGELSQNVDLYSGVHTSTTYDVIVVDTDSATEVKLFVLPTFINSNFGYKLEYWLYTGTRSEAINVTDSITHVGFDGTSYGTKQKVDFSINLANFSGLPEVVFSDSIDIQLSGEPLDDATMYRLWYWRDDTRWYGENLRAKLLASFGTTTLTLTNGIGSLGEWLDTLYYRLSPLYDADLLDQAPAASHVDVIIGSVTIPMDINTYWNGEIPWNTAVPAHGTNVILKWYTYGEGGNRLDLAISNMPLEVV